MSGWSGVPPGDAPRGQNGGQFGEERTEPLLPPAGGWPALPPGYAGELALPPGHPGQLALPPGHAEELVLPPGHAGGMLLLPAGGSGSGFSQTGPTGPSLEALPPGRGNPWLESRRWTMGILMVSLALLVVCGLPVWGFGLWSAWASDSDVTPPVVAVLNAGGQGASDVEWSPDGRYLAEQVSMAGATGGEAVVLWDVQTRREVRSFTGADGGVALAWSPDGKWLATTNGEVTLLWLTAKVETAGGFETPTARLAAPDKHEAITGLAWSKDGETLAMVDEGGLGIWQLTSGVSWQQIHYFDDGPCATISCGRGLLWSPDGRWLVASPWHGKDGTSGVGVWNADTWAEQPLLGAADALAWSPDSSVLVVRNADETTLSGVSVDSWKTAWTIDPNRDVHQGYRVFPEAAGWSPNGEWLAGSMDGWVDLWPTDTRKSAWVWEQQDQSEAVYTATCLSWSPDGHTLAVTTDGVGRVLLYDLSNPSPPGAGPPEF